MRSWRELAIGLVACASACTGTAPADDTGDDDPGDPCATSYLTYENFGEPFVANWCRSCHSSQVPVGMRQTAPDDVNFDDLADVRAFADRISFRAGVQKTMPPAGGPSDEERALLVEWVGCGTR
jgi:uncharacterized membrane protein